MGKVGSEGEPDLKRMQEGRLAMSSFPKKLQKKNSQDLAGLQSADVEVDCRIMTDYYFEI